MIWCNSQLQLSLPASALADPSPSSHPPPCCSLRQWRRGHHAVPGHQAVGALAGGQGRAAGGGAHQGAEGRVIHERAPVQRRQAAAGQQRQWRPARMLLALPSSEPNLATRALCIHFSSPHTPPCGSPTCSLRAILPASPASPNA